MTSRIAVKSLGRVRGPAGQLYSFQEESGDQQNSYEVSRKSLGTSKMAVKSLGRIWRPADWL